MSHNYSWNIPWVDQPIKLKLSRDLFLYKNEISLLDHVWMATSSNDSSSGNPSSSLPVVCRSTSESKSETSHSDANPRQARYWIGTIPREHFTPSLPDSVQWIKGQLERGESGYEHWQICFSFATKKSLKQVVSCFSRRGWLILIKTLWTYPFRSSRRLCLEAGDQGWRTVWIWKKTYQTKFHTRLGWD